MQKRVILLMLSAVLLLVGCGSQEYIKNPTNAGISTIEEETNENEIKILSYSYKSNVTTAILLDAKENILYGLVKITLNNAGSQPGEFFMLVDPEGNPYAYDGDTSHIPELILHEQAELEDHLITYIFSDSIYNIRYALLFTYNNNAGAYTGNIITLLDTAGNPSTY